MVRGTQAGLRFPSPRDAADVDDVDEGLEDEVQPEPDQNTLEVQLNAIPGIPDPTTNTTMAESSPPPVLPRNVFNAASMRTALMPPRIDRLIYQDKCAEAFTGGSNLTCIQYFPQHSGQHHPSKYSSIHDCEDKLRKGMEFKLGEDGESNGVELTFWFDSLATNLELLGLDTVFKIPQPGWTREINLAVNWGNCRASLVKPWLKLLKTGLYDAKQQKMCAPCPYDKQNMYYSGVYILASLTSKHRLNMLRELQSKPDGREVLVHVLKIRMNLFSANRGVLLLN